MSSTDYVVTLWAFSGDTSLEQIVFSEASLLKLVPERVSPPGWAFGVAEVGGAQGFFPLNYTEPYEPEKHVNIPPPVVQTEEPFLQEQPQNGEFQGYPEQPQEYVDNNYEDPMGLPPTFESGPPPDLPPLDDTPVPFPDLDSPLSPTYVVEAPIIPIQPLNTIPTTSFAPIRNHPTPPSAKQPFARPSGRPSPGPSSPVSKPPAVATMPQSSPIVSSPKPSPVVSSPIVSSPKPFPVVSSPIVSAPKQSSPLAQPGPSSFNPTPLNMNHNPPPVTNTTNNKPAPTSFTPSPKPNPTPFGNSGGSPVKTGPPAGGVQNGGSVGPRPVGAGSPLAGVPSARSAAPINRTGASPRPRPVSVFIQNTPPPTQPLIRGKAPPGYVAPAAPTQPAENGGSSQPHSNGVSHGGGNQSNGGAGGGGGGGEPVLYCEALYDYEGDTSKNIFTFPKGALIELKAKNETGWWTGILDGQLGYFPSNFVKEVSPRTAGSNNFVTRTFQGAATTDGVSPHRRPPNGGGGGGVPMENRRKSLGAPMSRSVIGNREPMGGGGGGAGTVGKSNGMMMAQPGAGFGGPGNPRATISLGSLSPLTNGHGGGGGGENSPHEEAGGKKKKGAKLFSALKLKKKDKAASTGGA